MRRPEAGAMLCLEEVDIVIVRVTPSPGGRLPLPGDPARRAAHRSLLMVAVTMAAGLVAGAVGTFLQLVVFDLEDQQLLSDVGPWGYVAASFLLALMIAPAAIGVALGVRARRLGERRLAVAGIAANVLAVSYLVATAIAFLVR
jgi:MFS family permease